MARGRKPAGSKVVESLVGSSESKRRLRVLIETIIGCRTVQEAARELDLSLARVYSLRVQALQAAMDRLEARSPGRPSQEASKEEDQIKELKSQVDHLRFDLWAARRQNEIRNLLGQDAPDKSPPMSSRPDDLQASESHDHAIENVVTGERNWVAASAATRFRAGAARQSAGGKEEALLSS